VKVSGISGRKQQRVQIKGVLHRGQIWQREVQTRDRRNTKQKERDTNISVRAGGQKDTRNKENNRDKISYTEQEAKTAKK